MGLVKNSNCIYFRYCARLLYETRTKIYYPTLLRLLALQATASTHKWPGVDLKILQAEGRLDSKLQIALGNMPIPWETSMGKPTKPPQWRFCLLRPGSRRLADNSGFRRRPSFPTPRTIEFIGKVMQNESDTRVIQAMATACCGEGFSAQLATFLKDVGANIPRLLDIKKDPKGTKVPTDPHHQFVVASAISEAMTENDASTWAIYLARLPAADLASMAAHNAIKRVPKCGDVKALKNLILE